ncbi:NAD-dependent epimerase/dehydratase family protein [Pseudoalteromonas sp. bablab_jr004]|uniref:NAD-dependent epimerase/dehydratase family protein n=1 Tax=Pseudoalteromonas sp. bablab_jr004 TaxID=2755065 RepID=UPI0018F35C94|nr:NAD-dependent epimerase/dehydratase family protein [Pseudoalteromonas sp. bablab_jr004]
MQAGRTRVLITGATGFIGRNLVKSLNECYEISALVRHELKPNTNIDFINVGEFSRKTNLKDAFSNIDIVIHLAAKAHITNTNLDNSPESYKDINIDFTLKLAKHASACGVKRFIFLSSVGVLGVSNVIPFNGFDKPSPIENYSISKLHAELALKKITAETNLQYVIIRPPLVYGKGAPGNFGTLLKVAKKNLPLPLGAINNRRSFVSIDNLVNLIITCIDHPHAANQTFLVSDDEDISTSDLLKKLTLAAGKKPWLLPMPVSFLKFLAAIVGKKAAVDRFSSSLTVDIEHTKKTLNWKPPITLDEGIRRCFK